MATTTTNYGLPVPEGSDIVNLLTVLPQLAQLVDAQMKVNANTGIQRGTHAKSGTVNAITVDVNLATATFFTFVAADDFVEGDSFTFNGEVIAARTPEGNALKTGAFKVNQNVLCCNYNGILTIYTSQSTISVDTQLDAKSANAIANAAVTAAINAINAAIGSADISTIGTDVKAAIVALNNSIGSANGAISAINGQLSYAGDTFYLDKKDGKLGMNTDPARGADTFLPFSKGLEKIADFSSTKVIAENLEAGIYAVHITHVDAAVYGSIDLTTALGPIYSVVKASLTSIPGGGSFPVGDYDMWVALAGSGTLKYTDGYPAYNGLISGEAYRIALP